MGQESVDLENVARQVVDAQRAAMRCMEKAYYSQNGKGKINEALLREGQSHLKTADSLIRNNLPGFVEQLNPSTLMEKMLAAGVSYPAAAHACRAINMYRAGMALEGSAAAVSTIAGGGAGGGALLAAAPYVAGAAVAVAFAFLCYEIYQWLNTPRTPPPAVVKHYENQLGAKPAHGYKPFEGRMLPRNL